MERVVIFSAGSFIGKNLIKELHNNYKLRLVTTKRRYLNDILTTIDCGMIGIIEQNFGPDTDFDSVLEAGDIVFHLASSTNPTTSNQNISDEIANNVLSSARLFEACVRKKIKRLVFISSGGTVYGRDAKCPIVEDNQTNPINSYGLQKLAIEKMLYVFNITYGLDYRIVRLSNPYGPYQRPNRKLGVIATFLYNAINNKEIRVYGDGTVIRDFIYIDDAVRAIRTLMENDCNYRVYNIGSGIGTSIKEVLTIIQGEVRKKMKITFGEKRKVDVSENYLDISRYNFEFGWRDTLVNLVDGIHLTREFLESGLYEID